MNLVKGLPPPQDTRLHSRMKLLWNILLTKEKQSVIETHTSAYHAPYYTSPRRHIILGNWYSIITFRYLVTWHSRPQKTPVIVVKHMFLTHLGYNTACYSWEMDQAICKNQDGWEIGEWCWSQGVLTQAYSSSPDPRTPEFVEKKCQRKYQVTAQLRTHVPLDTQEPMHRVLCWTQ